MIKLKKKKEIVVKMALNYKAENQGLKLSNEADDLADLRS